MKWGLLASGGYFFLATEEFTFPSKWAGLWKGHYRLISSIEILVNGRKATPNNFSTNCTSKGLRITVPNVTGNITLKIGVDLRSKDIDKIYEDNSVSVEKNVLRVKNSISELTIYSNQSMKLVKKEYIESIPGRKLKYKMWNESKTREQILTIDTVVDGDLSFTFSREKNFVHVLPEYDIPEVPQFRQLMEYSLHITQGFENSNGFFAGYPYFTMNWGRDSVFAIFTYNYLKRFEHAKKSLQFLAKHQKDGEILNWAYYDESKIEYGSFDSTPLWLAALADYVSRSGDTEFLDEMEDNIESAVDYYKRISGRDGLVEFNEGWTWMETWDRKGKPIEPQAFWYFAFKKLAQIKGASFEQQANHIKRSVLKKYRNGDWFHDRLVGKKASNEKTINPIFLLWSGMLDKEDAEGVFKTLEGPEFTTEFGVRSMSAWDEQFENSYHKGAVWGFLTSIAALSEAKYGRKEQAKKYLDIQKRNVGLRCDHTLDEFYDSEPQGCMSQLWSACILPIAIIEYNKI